MVVAARQTTTGTAAAKLFPTQRWSSGRARTISPIVKGKAMAMTMRVPVRKVLRNPSRSPAADIADACGKKITEIGSVKRLTSAASFWPTAYTPASGTPTTSPTTIGSIRPMIASERFVTATQLDIPSSGLAKARSTYFRLRVSRPSRRRITR